ncbi:MAG TPA: FAD-dependent oxidoreductase [Bordetella sp.]
MTWHDRPPGEPAHAGNLWRATAGLPDGASPPLDGSAQADVAVVGAGYLGLSTAMHLAESGRKVVLLEAGDIGFGASGRNGGQVNPGLKWGREELVHRFGPAGDGFFRLGEEGPAFLAELVRRKNLDCNLSFPGVLRCAHNVRALKNLDAACADLRARGIDARRLDAAQTEAHTGTTAYAGALLDMRGGSVHALALARGLARAAADSGAAIHCNSPVLAAVRHGKQWELRTATGSVRAHGVVVATNGYTDQLVPGLARTLLPVNCFQIATGVLPAHLQDSILPGGQAVYDSRRLILFFRKSPDGRLMLGGRASFSSQTGSGEQASDYHVLERVLHGIYPQTRELPVEYRWRGLVCLTPDFLPHYHRPADGMHVLVGMNGRGVALATRAGAWLSDTILGKTGDTGVPATPIRPIALHGLRAPVLNAVMKWNWLMDLAGR